MGEDPTVSEEELLQPLLPDFSDDEEEAAASPLNDSNDDDGDNVAADDDGRHVSRLTTPHDRRRHSQESSLRNCCATLYHATLLPDHEITLCEIRLIDGPFAVRLLKFLALTFASIAVVHYMVARLGISDRDCHLQFWQIWLFQGDAILRDGVVFFLLGRLWQRPGVDSCSWIVWMILANVYFECQGYFPWMGHSVTLYEMHCVWPWQLWVFVACVTPLFFTIVMAHVVVAYRQGILGIKIGEFMACLGFFLAPVVGSPYFHFHHWFAGTKSFVTMLYDEMFGRSRDSALAEVCGRRRIWNFWWEESEGKQERLQRNATTAATTRRPMRLSTSLVSTLLMLQPPGCHCWNSNLERKHPSWPRHSTQASGHQDSCQSTEINRKSIFPAFGQRPLLAIITEPNACESDQLMDATFVAIEQAVQTKQVDLVSIRLDIDNHFEDERKKLLERATSLAKRLMTLSQGEQALSPAASFFKVVCSSNIVLVAVKARVHGVHVKESHLERVPDIIRQFQYPIIIGTSTHSLDTSSIKNDDLPVDYYFVGTCYMTESHAEKSQNDLQGPALPGKLKCTLSPEYDIPVFAIGGINDKNCQEPVSLGADGVAVIRAVLQANDPAKMVRNLHQSMHVAYENRR